MASTYTQKMTTEEKVRMTARFTDEDTRIISMDSPRSGLSRADIEATADLAEVCLIGDVAGAPFREWRDAAIVDTTNWIATRKAT